MLFLLFSQLAMAGYADFDLGAPTLEVVIGDTTLDTHSKRLLEVRVENVADGPDYAEVTLDDKECGWTSRLPFQEDDPLEIELAYEDGSEATLFEGHIDIILISEDFCGRVHLRSDLSADRHTVPSDTSTSDTEPVPTRCDLYIASDELLHPVDDERSTDVEDLVGEMLSDPHTALWDLECEPGPISNGDLIDLWSESPMRGMYYVDRAIHVYDTNGYLTDFEIRRSGR